MFSESWPMLYNIDSSLVYKRLIASQIRVGGQLRSGAAGRCSGFSSLKVRKISTFQPREQPGNVDSHFSCGNRKREQRQMDSKGRAESKSEGWGRTWEQESKCRI
jgi:hypothetical protein